VKSPPPRCSQPRGGEASSQGNLVPPPQSDLAAEGSTARVRRNRIALVVRFELEAARVRVRKPAVRLEAPVEWTAATVERRRR
jgi:hypothetical protein